MSDTVRVSVVLPVRNGEPFLASAIASILAQSLRCFELIVIDDGSDDDSAEIVSVFVARDPRVKLLRCPGSGLVAALECGRALAVGDIIARMDADDIAAPDRLERQVAFLDDNPEVVVVGGQIFIIDAGGRAIRRGRYPLTDAECKRHLPLAAPFAHPTVAIRAEALEACGGYRARFAAAEDYDLWLRLAKCGAFANLAATVLTYRDHAGGLTKRKAVANATAFALAFVEDLCGVDAVEAALGGNDVRDWRSREAALPADVGPVARAAYLRGLILNGGIADAQEMAFLRASLPDLVRTLATQTNGHVLAFMLTRGVMQATRNRRFIDAAFMMAAAARYVPAAMLKSVWRVAIRAR